MSQIPVVLKDSGAKTAISDDELESAVNSGNVLIPNKEYEVVAPSGEKGTVPGVTLAQALASGYKIYTDSQKEDDRLQEKYGNQTGKALLLGALRGTTLGLSDQIATKTGIASEEELSQLEKRNPGASIGGEIIGTIAPALLSGGESLIAKAASKLPSQLAVTAAESAGKRAAQNVTSKLAQKAVNLGAAGLVEGMIQGAGRAVTEDAMGDHEFNAESLISNIGVGGLVGGVLGATGGVALYGLEKAGGKISKFRKEMLDKSNLSKDLKKTIEDRIGIEQQVEDYLAQSGKSMDDVRQALTNRGMEFPEWMTSEILPKRELGADLAASKSIAGELVRKDVSKAYDQVDTVTNAFLQGAKQVDPEDLGNVSKNAITKTIEDELEPARLLYEDLDQVMQETPLTESLKKRFVTEQNKNFFQRVTGRGQSYLDEFSRLETAKDAQLYRTIIGKDLKKARIAGDSNLEGFLSQLYGDLTTVRTNAFKYNMKGQPFTPKVKQIADNLEKLELADSIWKTTHDKFDFLKEHLGIKARNMDDLIEQIQELNPRTIAKKIEDIKDPESVQLLRKEFPELAEMARASFIDKLAKNSKNIKGEFNPRKFYKEVEKLSSQQMDILFPGIKDTKKVVADMRAITAVLPDNINPSGTARALALGNILDAGYHGKELLRYALLKRGDDSFKKYMTIAMPTYATLEQSANRSKNIISKAASGFYKQAQPAIIREAVRPVPEKDLNKAIKVYRQVQTSPDQLLDRLIKGNQSFFSVAPKTGSALQARMIAGIQFLQSKIPSHGDDFMMSDYKPSKSELIGFSDYLTAIENPLDVVKSIKMGGINPRQLEALKVVYPKIYASLQAELNAKMPKRITRQQKVTLQTLLGVNMLPSMTPQGMAILQSSAPMEQQQAKPSVVGMRDLNLAGRTASASSKIASR